MRAAPGDQCLSRREGMCREVSKLCRYSLSGALIVIFVTLLITILLRVVARQSPRKICKSLIFSIQGLDGLL